MSGEDVEIVDPITQLAMMLEWNDDYSDEFKRINIELAVRYVMGEPHQRQAVMDLRRKGESE